MCSLLNSLPKPRPARLFKDLGVYAGPCHARSGAHSGACRPLGEHHNESRNDFDYPPGCVFAWWRRLVLGARARVTKKRRLAGRVKKMPDASLRAKVALFRGKQVDFLCRERLSAIRHNPRPNHPRELEAVFYRSVHLRTVLDGFPCQTNRRNYRSGNQDRSLFFLVGHQNKLGEDMAKANFPQLPVVVQFESSRWFRVMMYPDGQETELR